MHLCHDTIGLTQLAGRHGAKRQHTILLTAGVTKVAHRQQPANQLVVRHASQRLGLIEAFGGKPQWQHCGLTCRPRVLSGQNSTQAVQEVESRWTASMQADPAGRGRRRSDIPD